MPQQPQQPYSRESASAPGKTWTHLREASNGKKRPAAFAAPVARWAAAEADDTRLVGFDEALREAFIGMAEDTIAIRKRRAEKRAKAAAAGE